VALLTVQRRRVEKEMRERGWRCCRRRRGDGVGSEAATCGGVKEGQVQGQGQGRGQGQCSGF